MTKVIGVRFQTSGRIYYFDPVEFDIQEGNGVIVETARGQEYGDVIQGITEVEDTMIVSPLKPVIRLATEQDTNSRAQNTGKEEEAFTICQKKIEQHGLDMKLVNVEYSFNGSKVVFYFTADERVDFRELVKDLASQFRTRIELRQIGVRDEAKMLGGLGSCGRPVCCKVFLDEFRPVSIKMAKEQNLSLSPTKISGLCGRLMCCLQYEQAGYEEMKKKMPRTNREVLTPDGPGFALENNVITEKTRVRLVLLDGSIDVRDYHYSLIGKPGEPLPEALIAAQAEAAAARTAQQVENAQSHTQSAQPNGEQETDKADANKPRHHRGGKGRGNNRPQGQEDRQQGGQAQPAQRADGVQNGLPARQMQGTQLAKQKPVDPPEKSVSNGEETQTPNYRRRRRSAANHPKPERMSKPE